MQRGKISNRASQELWVHSSAALRLDAHENFHVPPFFVDWLWIVSQNVRPILVWTQPPVPYLGDEHFADEYLFNYMSHAVQRIQKSPRILHMIVGNSALVGTHTRLWSPDSAAYGAARYGCTAGVSK